MKKGWKIFLIISATFMMLMSPLMVYFHWLGLFDPNRQTIEIERVWRTDGEKEALIKAEGLDYWTYLREMRYEDGNQTGTRVPSNANFVDKQVIDNGKDIISSAKRPFNVVSNHFEYMAYCSMVDTVEMNTSVVMANDEIRFEIVLPLSFLSIEDRGSDQLYSGYVPINRSVGSHRDHSLVYPQSLFEPANKTIVFRDVYLIRMGTMLSSFNKRWDVGGGNGVDQLVLMDRDLNVVLVIVNMIKHVV